MNLLQFCLFNIGNVYFLCVLICSQSKIPNYSISPLKIFCKYSQNSFLLCSEPLQTVSLNLFRCALAIKWSYLYHSILLQLHSFLLRPCLFSEINFSTQSSSLDLQGQRQIKQKYLVYPLCWLRRKFTIFKSTQTNHEWSWYIFCRTWMIVFCSVVILIEWPIGIDLYLLPL